MKMTFKWISSHLPHFENFLGALFYAQFVMLFTECYHGVPWDIYMNLNKICGYLCYFVVNYYVGLNNNFKEIKIIQRIKFVVK